MSAATVTVGAVAYHERVVPIWETFKTYFAGAGVPTDYVLYSNYERLVGAVLAGEVDVGWNTNTAYVHLHHRCRGTTRILGLRDLDARFATVACARRADGVGSIAWVRGKRFAVGSRDSGHAAILPLHYLKKEGIDATVDCELIRFDTDLGKHGDTGDSEMRVLEAVAAGRADAGAIGDATWVRLKGEGFPPTAHLEIVWKSPAYYHCNFTALEGFDAERASAWSRALLAMDYGLPHLRHAMDLEGVKRWLPGDDSGYGSLREAMADQGYLA